MRYDHLVSRVRAAVFDSPAHTPPALRRAVAEQRLAEVPENLRAYVAKVAQRAYTVSDDDIRALTEAGYTEDEIFEITGAAAVGAALLRLDRAMSVLRERVS